jgi:type III pantothenate kinase
MLAIDIGNTHTVLGLYREGRLARKWRLTTRPTATSDEIEMRVRNLLDLGHFPVDELHCAVLATVVPSLDRTWRKALERILPTGQVVSLSHSNCGFPVEYSNPAQIGPDRLANALGVERLGLRDAIVIDLGTATTFDVVKEGRYLGGAIAPGIETGMLALTGRTARLPQVAIEVPSRATGRSTETALHSGILLGHVGMMEYMVRRILREEGFGIAAKVIATGGWSQVLRGLTDVVHSYQTDLTLDGLEWFSRTRLETSEKRHA